MEIKFDFGAFERYSSVLAPRGNPIVADFTGDGYPDILTSWIDVENFNAVDAIGAHSPTNAVINASFYLTIIVNDGNGTFGNGTTGPAAYNILGMTYGLPPWDIHAGCRRTMVERGRRIRRAVCRWMRCEQVCRKCARKCGACVLSG